MRGFLSTFKLLTLLSAGFIFTHVNAQDEVIEEVVVTASFIDRASSDLGNPLHVLDGEQVSDGATSNIGEALEGLLGVSSADFGSAVGQPIIRGMMGNRVKLLNNEMVIRDVSGLGVDHENAVDLNNIEQIEVIRGPSSLLYANGAIGGIVNIVDNTIAKQDFTETDFRIGLEGQTVNDGNSYDLSFQDNLGGINLSIAYKESDFGNYDIPGGAVIHSEEHDDHDEEVELGYLENSDQESKAGKFGLSKTGDWGHIGISYNKLESTYGIPFHGDEHDDHEAKEDDHDDHDDHDDGDHDGAAHEEDSHEGERIFSVTDSDIFTLEGSYNIDTNWLKQISYHFKDTDYLHTEQHAEEEGGHDDHGHGEEGPTNFMNEATEYGAIFDLSNDSLLQKVVVNFVQEDIAIIGTEAFMNPSDNEELTLGYYLSKEFDQFHFDIGIRHDRINRRGSVTTKVAHDDDHDDDHDAEETTETANFDRDINSTSFAFNLGRDLTESLDANLSFSRVERAPAAVEMFMNGPHLVTGRNEVGNVNLDSEVANNIDLTFTFEQNGFFGSFSYFRNDVDDYIYLQDETEEEHDDHDDDHGGLIMANYLQKDAELTGYEFEIGKVFELSKGELGLSFGRDSVDAEFSDGSNIPRMVPERNIYTISYGVDDLSMGLTLKDVKKQDDIGLGETLTSGYQMLNFRLSTTFDIGGSNALNVSLFAKNLMDEVARNHSSFVKNEVPLPGRNYGLKLNLKI